MTYREGVGVLRMDHIYILCGYIPHEDPELLAMQHDLVQCTFIPPLFCKPDFEIYGFIQEIL